MGDDERFRRSDPEREAPRRTWDASARSAKYWRGVTPREQPAESDFAGTGAGGAKDRDHRRTDGHPFDPPWSATGAMPPVDPPWPGAGGMPPLDSQSWSDSVARGVDLGYRVAEEQIRQAQEMAQRFAPQADAPMDSSDELWDMLRRALRYSEDMAGLLFQFLGSLTDRPELRDYLRSAANQERRGDPTMGRHASGSAVGTEARPHSTAAPEQSMAVEVQCSRPTRVRVQLDPGIGGGQLICHGLHPVPLGDEVPDSPPLRDVRILSEGDRILILEIMDEQPAGRYAGAIVDQRSQLPCGSISVEILGPVAEIYPFTGKAGQETRGD